MAPVVGRMECGSVTARILVGDVRAKLATLPDNHCHVCVTSPPYFGLRSYGTPPQVWGGDPDCYHEWGDEQRGKRKDIKPPSESASVSRMGLDGRQGLGPPSGGYFCQSCGAWLGHLGLEPTLALFIEHLVAVFREVRRVLRPDGTCWLNIGDSYAGSGPSGAGYQSETTKRREGMKQDGNFRLSARLAAGDPGYAYKKPHVIPAGLKPKDLMLVPHRLAIALQDDGWWVRSDIIWHKRAPMPESVTDRPTSAHEHIFLLTKAPKYFYDGDAIREPYNEDSLSRYDSPLQQVVNGANQPGGDPSLREKGKTMMTPNPMGRNTRNVWTLSPEPFPAAHFATFPTEIPRRCIKAGTSEKGACAACGAPWRRVVERIKADRDVEAQRAYYAARTGRTDGHVPGPSGIVDETITTGWAPSCACFGTWQEVPGEPDWLDLDELLGRMSRSTRPQTARAADLFVDAGLGIEHAKAIRAVGIADTGKALTTTNGAGHNRDDVQALADEARAALKGYYREFLLNTPKAQPVRVYVPGPDDPPPVPCRVLDPFLGSGTTLLVADELGRDGIGIELSPEYATMAEQRIRGASPMFAAVDVLK